jgi:DedD protein
MASSKDTEITLGTGSLLGVFFGLVIICAVFFGFGYMLGRKSDTGVSATTAQGGVPATARGTKPGGSPPAANAPMTFYKNVEQKDASAQLTPASENVSANGAAAGRASEGSASDRAPSDGPAAGSDAANTARGGTSADPSAAGSSYLVQVAAVSKQDDADALVEALKKKQYPAFVAASAGTDKLFRVQVGPFSDIKAAESTRSHLVDDGYNPILKK